MSERFPGLDAATTALLHELEAEMEADLADSARRRDAFVAEFSKPLPNWPLRLWVSGWALVLAAALALVLL